MIIQRGIRLDASLFLVSLLVLFAYLSFLTFVRRVVEGFARKNLYHSIVILYLHCH